jgi:type IV pilus assembly protein PilY1
LPVNAGITIPSDPLTSAARVAPNILFILDDSGSMVWGNLNSQDISQITGSGNFSSVPDGDGVSTGTSITSETTGNDAMYMQDYVTNSLFYNPATTYQPWMGPVGNRLTGGTSYTSVYSDDKFVTNVGAGTNSGSKDLSQNTQTFYVPKDPTSSNLTYLSTVDNYYRYQISPGGTDVRRGVYGRVVTGRRVTNSCDGDSNGSWGWINCTSATPTGRSVADEATNFATWYSYYRTRTKAAKAGASEGFNSLGNRVRVGFRTIWNRNNFDIPVQDGNDGRFVNNVADPTIPGNTNTTSRTTWYNHLFAATANNSTPLQDALNSAGQYFSSSASSGPYGPESGSNQLSCRQNFTILTTDGYWNNNTAGTGNVDNASGSTIKGPKGKTYTYSPTAPFKDGYSSTLADVAMKYWKTDLRTEDYMGNSTKPDNNNVPSTTADPAFWQHMVTFSIAIGLKTTSGWSSVAGVPANPVWPDPDTANPTNDNAKRIDDLLHAAVDGHGEFVSATSPQVFARALVAALAIIAQRTSSYSNVATNAASLRTGGQVFNASYVSGLWSGAVKSFNLDGPGGTPGTLKWTATVPAWSVRKIYTYNGAGTSFPASGQIAALTRTGGPVDFPVSGAENANYLKGKPDLEGTNPGNLRPRTSVIGDIVGSSPAYVDDTKTLYVGANDGMLHAFNSDDGTEQFAYVPGLINFNDLATLSRGDYNDKHKFFVDGPIVVSNRKLTPGKNLLVGALGRGGKGVYFLDVSTPSAFSTANVTKELAETSGGNMGLVMGRPILGKVKSGDATAAVFGNGVNSSRDRAVLVVANLETGAVIGEVDTGVGSSTTPNGLSAPTGVVGPDGKTLAYVYAGDLLGNVWKFDIRDASPSNWTKTLLFTAKLNGTGAAQPITGAVTVAIDPRTYKRWVFFGTGSYLTVSDANDKSASAQSMYGFVDSDTTVAYSDLDVRTIINTGVIQNGFPVRTFESKQDLTAGKKGWYINLPGAGERIVQDSQVVANILITASMMPTGDACEVSGSGYINAVDAFTGTSAGSSFFDLNGDGKTTDTVVGDVPVGSVNFGVGMPTLPIFLDGRLIVGGTGGDNGGGDKPGSGGIPHKTWSQVSWREIKGD